MDKQPQKHVIVIGGGIIGLSVTEQLLHEGHAVTMIEKDKVAAGASYGNAAGFAFSEILPLASVSTMRKSVSWFFDPLGSFSVVLKDLPSTVGWLVRFALSARQSVYKRSVETLAELMKLEKKTLAVMHERTGLDSMVEQKGAIFLYENQKQYQNDLKGWQLRGEHGVPYECFEGDALHEFQGGLSESVIAGIYAPDYLMVSNPYDYCEALHLRNASNGAISRYDEVTAIEPDASGVAVQLQNGGSVHADKLVVAAGPWSASLAAGLGDKVAMVGERGYNTTLPKSAFPDLDRTLFFAEQGFVMSPLADGVRVGGASEIASLEREPAFKRSVNMLHKAKQMVPVLKTDKGEQWMGRRPTIPDTLPVIGQSPQSADVIYAFGHGHLGLTLATSTAQLVSDLMHEREPGMDIQALRVGRF